MKTARAAVVLGSLILGFLIPTSSIGRAGKVHIENTYSPELGEVIRTGWIQVMENRSVRKGRMIKVHFAVLPARGTATGDPVITFSGGPGTSALNGMSRWARQFEKFRDERDILLVDQRGTGSSNPLPCRPLGDPDLAQTWLGDMYTSDYVTACKKALEKNADLRFYHTSAFVDDVEDIREALGYNQLNILTGSYGPKVALAYMQRYPDRVRCAFLWSCASPHTSYITYLAPHSQASLDRIFDDVETDPEASIDYPDLRREFQDILARLRQSPVTVKITNPFTGYQEMVSLGYFPFVAGIRSMLYSNSLRKWIPFYVYLAARGAYSPIAEYTAEYMRDVNETYNDGLYLCITCADDVDRMDVEEARALAAGTFMRHYRIDQQKMACDLWPDTVVPAGFYTPGIRDIPTLILSGEVDPVTPPLYGEIIEGLLPNSLHVVVPGYAHGISPLTEWWTGGFDETALKFVRQASLTGLDFSSAWSYTPPPYVSWRDYLDAETDDGRTRKSDLRLSGIKKPPDRKSPVREDQP